MQQNTASERTSAFVKETARGSTRAFLTQTARVRASHHLKECAGALSDEGNTSMRFTLDGTQSREKGKEKRWCERWRDERKKKDEKRRNICRKEVTKRRQDSENNGVLGGDVRRNRASYEREEGAEKLRIIRNRRKEKRRSNGWSL